MTATQTTPTAQAAKKTSKSVFNYHVEQIKKQNAKMPEIMRLMLNK